MPDALPGAQKFRWNPATRSLDLVWFTDQATMNNVLTYSDGAGLVYGTGRDGETYTFYVLNWETGETVVEQPLGTDLAFVGSGNQVVVLRDRSAAYGSGGLLRIGPEGTVVATELGAEMSDLEVFPNPTVGRVRPWDALD